MCRLIIFRTTSNISIERIACDDNTNYSETAETEKAEPEKLLPKSYEPLLNKDTPVDEQLPKKEISHSLVDVFRKPYEKTTAKRGRDRTLDEIKKGREERLAALRETKQHECNDPIQIFFKSMALTVSTFPPELAVEAKMRVFNIVSEMELRSLKAKANMNTLPVEPTTSTSSSNLQVPTIFGE